MQRGNDMATCPANKVCRIMVIVSICGHFYNNQWLYFIAGTAPDTGIVPHSCLSRGLTLPFTQPMRSRVSRRAVFARSLADAHGLPADAIAALWDLLVETSIAYEMAAFDRR